MRPTLANSLAVAYLLLTVGLLAFAVSIWNLRCEGFGCMGIGVAWMAWGGCFCPILIAGLIARAQSGLNPRLACAVLWTLGLQGLVGLGLGFAWAVHRIG